MIEALVVMAIGSMALVVVFSIGRSATDNGFRLGRSALSAADTEVAIADVRVVLSSLLLRPTATIRDPERHTFTGEGATLEGEAVMLRSTACAPRGWQGRLKLTIEARQGQIALVCTAGDRTVSLMRLAPGAAFAYSVNGDTWASAWTNDEEAVGAPSTPEPLRPASLLIKLVNPGRTELIEALSSGLPETWVMASDEF